MQNASHLVSDIVITYRKIRSLVNASLKFPVKWIRMHPIMNHQNWIYLFVCLSYPKCSCLWSKGSTVTYKLWGMTLTSSIDASLCLSWCFCIYYIMVNCFGFVKKKKKVIIESHLRINTFIRTHREALKMVVFWMNCRDNFKRPDWRKLWILNVFASCFELKKSLLANDTPCNYIVFVLKIYKFCQF